MMRLLSRFINYGNTVLEHLRRDWLFHLVQLCVLVLAVYWWWHVRAPGYAIGVLAVLAVVMNFHTQMGTWDKSSWVLTMAAFLMLEFRAIANFNLQEATQRDRENKEFRKIAEGVEDATARLENLKNSQENGFQKTFKLLGLLAANSRSPEVRTAAAQVLKTFLSEITVNTLKTTTHDVVYRLITLHDNVLHVAIRLDNATSMRDTATILVRQKELREAEENYRSNKIWSEEVTCRWRINTMAVKRSDPRNAVQLTTLTPDDFMRGFCRS